VDTPEPQAPETALPEGEGKVKIAEEIVYAVILVILVACIVLVVLALLGPVVSNDANIIESI